MKIELKDVNYIYNEGLVNEVVAVEDINLEIGGKDFIALIGSTGSGKSTLIQMLNGLLMPVSGHIIFDGVDLFENEYVRDANKRGVTDKEGKKLSKKERKKAVNQNKQLLRNLRKKVGIVFQYSEHQLFDETILRDVSFGPKNLGLLEEDAMIKAKEALLAFGISEDMFEKSPFELSGGEMKRVAIAGVLAMEPEVLILDEPTAGLDPQGKIEILNKIKEIQKNKNENLKEGEEPMTIIFVSHNMEEVAEYADRVVAMHKGHIIMDGPVDDVFARYNELEKTGLSAPEVTYLCEELGINGVLKTDDAIKKIAAACR